MQKSLLIDVRAMGKSGLGRYVEDVVLGILPDLKLSFDVTLLVDRDLSARKLHEKNLSQYKTISTRPFTGLCRKYDFCWFPTLRQPLFGPKNRILTVHDLAQFKLERKTPKLLLRALVTYLIVFLQIGKSVGIIFNSDFTYNEYNYFFKKGMSLVNHLEIIKLTTRKVPMPTRATQINNNSLLFVGNLKYTKKLRTLISAISDIHDINLTVVSAGVGNFVDHSISYLDKINPEKIKIFSDVSDCKLREIYLKSDLLILPSLYEGWGYTPYEGLDHGCNVLISNIPPLNEMIKHDRIFFDPLDIKGLSHLIKEYISMSHDEKDKLYRDTLDKCTVRSLDKVRFETLESISRVLTAKRCLKN